VVIFVFSGRATPSSVMPVVQTPPNLDSDSLEVDRDVQFLTVHLSNLGNHSFDTETVSVRATTSTCSEEVIQRLFDTLRSRRAEFSERSIDYELVEATRSRDLTTICKERRLAPHEYPLRVQSLWSQASPRSGGGGYIQTSKIWLVLRRRELLDSVGRMSRDSTDMRLTAAATKMEHVLNAFLEQPVEREYQAS